MLHPNLGSLQGDRGRSLRHPRQREDRADRHQQSGQQLSGRRVGLVAMLHHRLRRERRAVRKAIDEDKAKPTD